MDAESDDSERWEDFYGSTTELTPTLLNIYDELNTTLEALEGIKSHANGTVDERDRKFLANFGFDVNSSPSHSSSPTSTAHNSRQASPVARSTARQRQSDTTPTTTTTSTTSHKHRNNFRLLSPSIQRIVTHSDVQPVDTIDIGALQQQQQQQQNGQQLDDILPSTSAQNFVKKQNPGTMSGHVHRSKLSHIPLSKVTGKLTQASNELVSTFDSSSEYLDALNYSPHDAPQRTSRLSTHATDDEKTPTNTEPTFSFDFNLARQHTGSASSPLQTIELLEIKQLATTTQLLSALSLSSPRTLLQDCNAADAGKHNRSINFGSQHETLLTVEAVNTSLVNKTLVSQTIKKLNHTRSLNLKETRSLSDTMPKAKSTPKSYAIAEDARKASTESLDRLTEMKSKFLPKDNQKMATLTLPEIVKLKHRPLSSSSLCSTTSSSSSGSDNVSGKPNTSYLASAESLADHSEPELSDLHAGMTVLERSCLEIIDSERNYVEDLRQVITGYLSDWKERACLSVSDLQTLFSNIEEIYNFSSKLLKQLEDATMDPLRISKCFINMRENFDVYAKYCTSYPEAISLLTKLLQATHTNALLTSTQKLLQHTLPLGSYLLKPVQRILKYHLLLDNLRKHCDVKEAFQAYEIMRQVARNIDQVKRRLEQQSRVKELSGILDGWLGPELTVLGELRLEGLLMDHNKPRMVFLFATMLIITKQKEDNRLQFKSYIHQNNLMLNEHLPGEPTSFYVIPYNEPRNQIKLTAKNRDQKRVWTQQIKEAMLEKFDNIPNRAKELVYKLGDEEERTPGKNSWKWTINSTSATPVYLERRNQYRRSELRNRSKLKRKTLTDLGSMEAVADLDKSSSKEEGNKTGKSSLLQNTSFDDNMVPILLRLATAVRHRYSSTAYNPDTPATSNPHCEHINTGDEGCACVLTDYGEKDRNSLRLKNRSKSVPRIEFDNLELDKEFERPPAAVPKLSSMKTLEIKQYNHKTMPKRVANLKKQRLNNNNNNNNNNNKRDTFKFYMDISEFDQSDDTNVLKITESTENLAKTEEQVDGNIDSKVALSTAGKEDTQKIAEIAVNESDEKVKDKAKKDAQIVLDLLKDNKEFERIYKKPQRKKSTESNQIKPGPLLIPVEPPRPPSSSPPLVKNEADECNEVDKQESEDPIYESLLRNVHVPYKFSPDFKRSKSLQCNPRREKKPLPPRPESDYVTLTYSPEGRLLQVENDAEAQIPQQPIALIDEPTAPLKNIEPEAVKTLLPCKEETVSAYSTPISTPLPVTSSTSNEVIYATPTKPKNLYKRLFVSNNGSRIASLENISNALLSRGSRRKSSDNTAPHGRSCSKPPERRASDVSEMCRLSLLHRQGSEALGERMAYLDYADPRTLFQTATPFAHVQRDSVFSLTSSSDSVYGQNNRTGKYSNTELAAKFEYEDNVEECLEQDFRDSAIYSDDNEKRAEYDQNMFKNFNKSLQSIPAFHRQHLPPPLPPKPPRLKALPPSAAGVGAGAGAGAIVCPPNMDQTTARSWVLKQIENFSK